MNRSCHIETFLDYAESLPRVLNSIAAAGVLAKQSKILIKPNLVNASPPPVTLPVAFVAVLVQFLQRHTAAEIIIAEGSGDRLLTTDEIFRIHGYDRLATEYNLTLVDLNEAPLVRLENRSCKVFPAFMMPEVLMESFVISAAVLKAHSLAEVTLSLKNMIGCAPPRYYQQGGHWKKSAFHRRMHESIFELNCYRKPDLALIDGSIGLAEYHLGGPPCDPPANRLIAGFDPVAVDAAGARLLGRRWQEIPHLAMAHQVLGCAEALELTED